MAFSVILVNLGTPEAPTARYVRPFLRQFLSDKRVIETPAILWRPILEGIILRVRPAASAKKYASIWYENDSPLMHWSKAQARGVREYLADRGIEADVSIAMRYGEPGLAHVLDKVYASGSRRVLVLPLYPQYAASSAGTVIDDLARWLLAARDQLEVRTVRSFPTDQHYIEALCSAIQEKWGSEGRPRFEQGEKLIFSFHSIPEAMAKAGDPYRAECEATARAVRERLGLSESEALTCFQSVFGPAKWIGPATIDTVAELGRQGCSRVDVICPGFAADCLETLEEINILNRSTFTDNGGGAFHYIEWANAHPAWIKALGEQVIAHAWRE